MPMLDSGFLRFRLLGSGGQSYIIEASEDLNFWQPIDTVVALGGLYDCTDPISCVVGRSRLSRIFRPLSRPAPPFLVPVPGLKSPANLPAGGPVLVQG
jgi:hypothetical protein